MRSLFVILLISLALPSVAGAATAGQLDSTFGTGGVFKQSVQTMFDVLDDVEILPDGRILAAGMSYDGATQPKVLVAQFLPNGLLDGSFSGDGMQVLSLSGTNSQGVNDLVIQPDGKIVLVGEDSGGSGDQALTVRLTATGELDGTFGGGFGWISRDWSGANTIVSAAAIEPDGDILSAGWDSGNLAFNRVQQNGNPRFDFVGSNTSYVQPLSAFADGAMDLALLPDGRFATVGFVDDSLVTRVSLTRHLQNGTPDPSFSGDGVLASELSPQYSIATSMILLPDNRMIVGGHLDNGAARDFFVARYTASGTLDPTFGVGGYTRVVQPGSDELYSIAQAPDGKLLLAGSTGSSPGPYNGDFQVVRLSADGVLDQGFGVGGVARVDLGANDHGFGVAVQPDGKPVAVGASAPSIQADDMAVIRLLAVSDPVISRLIPVSRITSPSRASLKRKRFKRFAGTAAPVGQVAKVELAVRRVNKSQLKKKRCLWLASSRARFTKIRSTRTKRCTRIKWLRARGTSRWSYALKKTLPPGRYEIYARATLKDGQTQKTFTATAGNFRKLTLR